MSGLRWAAPRRVCPPVGVFDRLSGGLVCWQTLNHWNLSMLKKFTVIALLLLFAGVTSLAWVSGEKRKEQQRSAHYKLKYASETQEYLKQYEKWLRLPPKERGSLPWGFDKDGRAIPKAQLLQEQQDRLNADLDKLAAGQLQMDSASSPQVYPFSDLLYGPLWQEKLNEYKSQKEFREFILTSSIFCLAAGGVIFSWCSLLSTARLLIKGLSAFRAFLSGFISRRRKTGTPQPIEPADKEVPECSDPVSDTSARYGAGRQQESNKRQKQVAGHSKVLINSGWHSPGETQPASPPAALKAGAAQLNSRPQNVCSSAGGEQSRTASGEHTCGELVPPACPERSRGECDRRVESSRTVLMVPQESSANIVDDLLKAQTMRLEKQVTEFRQMAQTVQQTAMEHSKPLENGLKELTEQISAIRDYAAQQQNRMEKLQDGYDWNIIRTFCLRVIRCIDNLEDRIAALSQQNLETTQLEEVKDELVFALESSGVEQFWPQLNSEYGGQEKKAEAVKDKSDCDDPDMSGKIAEIIRPGYQYVIDQENVKIVRMAQVKLFE